MVYKPTYNWGGPSCSNFVDREDCDLAWYTKKNVQISLYNIPIYAAKKSGNSMNLYDIRSQKIWESYQAGEPRKTSEVSGHC